MNHIDFHASVSEILLNIPNQFSHNLARRVYYKLFKALREMYPESMQNSFTNYKKF